MKCCREGKHTNTELIIELIRNELEAEGHETKRFSDSERCRTTAHDCYDCIVVKGNDGNCYELIVRECTESRFAELG